MAFNLCSTRASQFFILASTCRPESTGTSINLLFSRREVLAVAAAAVAATTIFCTSKVGPANAFDLRITVPDQTPEEAYAGVKRHARAVLGIKPLVESRSWREAQAELRTSSSYLKQDIYTIIQARPGSQRPKLRKLYSDLFNSVSRLDYAARGRDASAAEECYNKIATTIDEILTMIR